MEEHLWSVDFVSEEVVSEESSVGVWKVEAVLDGQIWQVSQEGVEVVVLSVGGVEVLSVVQVGSVVSDHGLEESHGVGVLVGVVWSLEEHSGVDVSELIVSHEHQGWGEEWGFAVWKLNIGSFLEGSESLLGELLDLLVLDVSTDSNNHLASDLVVLDKVSDLVSGDLTNVLSNSEDRLTEHMVSESSVVGRLQSTGHLVSLQFNDASVNSFSLSLDLVIFVGAVVVNFTEKLEGLLDLAALNGEVDGLSFSVEVNVDVSSKSHKGVLDLGS